MPDTSSERVLNLPFWLIHCCRWFWEKRWRIGALIWSTLALVLLWLIGWGLVTTPVEGPLKALSAVLSAQALLLSLLILIVMLSLLFFVLLSYIISHISDASLSPAWRVEKQRREEQQPVLDYKQIYLKALATRVRLLPRLGLGAELITPPSVQLLDIFIPLQLRAMPRPLRLQPLSRDELASVVGLDRQHRDYLLVDPRGEWERSLLSGERLEIQQVWAQLSENRPAAVIQGAPGMGKSTLLARITLSLCLLGQHKPDQQLKLNPVLIPILILIKEYADYLQSPVAGRDRSLMTFLTIKVEEMLSSQGVANGEVIVHELKEWLRNQQCLVMFDGLDEVSDLALQQEIQQAIHDFIEHERHPDVQSPTWNRFLITSRIAEYDAPALASYRYFLLAELSREQISDFLPRWYHTSMTTMESGSQGRIEQLTHELLLAYEKNDAVRKLAGNPLLLTLMAIMLHNGTSLPERRIDLYQAVVKTLLESRNEIKGLPKLYEDEAIQRLGELAFKMQSMGNNLAYRGDVENAVRQTLPVVEGVIDVGEYIKLISRRGGLFLERTNHYYGFIHRSFQEYFAARHMLREIEANREAMINEYVQSVRANPSAWREPFILAVAFKSDRDGGPVASSMLRALLHSRSRQMLDDALLAATCITEAKYVNLDTTIQQETVERLLAFYELAQREQRFDACDSIEQVIRDWLLVLREEEAYCELPFALVRSIVNHRQPERQRATLTLLCMLAPQLQKMRYNFFALLIPPLLALNSLDAVPPYLPAANVVPTSNLDIADLALTLLSLMGNRGPCGLLLKSTQQYFQDHPQLLKELAHYSLMSGTLITPFQMPIDGERFEEYCSAIDKWIALSDSFQPATISNEEIEACLEIHQTILNCARGVRYPAVLHIVKMLQRATIYPSQWRSIWQGYLLEQLEQASSIHYQQAILLWTLLFPELGDMQRIVERMLAHFKGNDERRSYSQRVLLVLSDDLKEARYLRYLNELRSSRYLREIRAIFEFRYIGGIKSIRGLKEFREIKDLKVLRYTIFLDEMVDLIDLRYVKDQSYLRDLRNSRDFRDVRNSRDFMALISLRSSRDFKEIRSLIDLLFLREVAEKARQTLIAQRERPDIDLLTILVGRILQIQEQESISQPIEAEVERYAALALDYLQRAPANSSITEPALSIIRSLPARTASEILLLVRIIQGSTRTHIVEACLVALAVAQPEDADAWREIEQGKMSFIPGVREIMNEVWKRKQSGEEARTLSPSSRLKFS